MSKVRIIFKILSLVSIPVTGYLAAKGAERYDSEMMTLYMEKDEADITRKDKAKAALKAYGPAAGAAVAGIISIIAMDRLWAKELLSAGALVAAGKKKLDEQAAMGRAYREATLEAVGPEKEAEIRADAAKRCIGQTFVNGEPTDETFHTFIIKDWIENGSSIKFNAPMVNVLEAFCETNRELFDNNSGCGVTSISDFLAFIGGEAAGYISSLTDAWGWNDCALVDADFMWVPFHIDKVPNEPNTYYIKTPIFPNYPMDADYPQTYPSADYQVEEVI